VHLNTIFLSRVLGDGDLALAAEDRQALSPRFWTNSNLLGRYHFTHPENLQDELRRSSAHASPPAEGQRPTSPSWRIDLRSPAPGLDAAAVDQRHQRQQPHDQGGYHAEDGGEHSGLLSRRQRDSAVATRRVDGDVLKDPLVVGNG